MPSEPVDRDEAPDSVELASSIELDADAAEDEEPNEEEVIGGFEIPGAAIPPTLPQYGQPLSLDQAINTTLLLDPVLRAGFEEIRQARADHWTASLRPNPELVVGQTLLPLTGPFIADIQEGGPPQLDVFLEYPIDWFLFGKRVAAMRSALQGVRVSQADYADLVRQRVLEVAIAYYDVLEAQALMALAEQDVANFMQVEEIARIGYENERLPLVELNRIRLDRLSSQQELRDARRDLVAAQATLLEVMGLEGTPWMYDVAESLDAPLIFGAPSLEESRMIAETNRPDIQALRWRISEAWANLDVERREAFPEVTPMLGYTRQTQGQAIGQPDADSWGFGVIVELPISDRNQGNRVRASSEVAQSGYELRAGLIELNAEIITVLAELETARENAIAIAEEQLELANQVLASIRQAYELGARPLIDVLDSQRNFRETYRNYIESRAAYWRAVNQFNATLGTPVLR